MTTQQTQIKTILLAGDALFAKAMQVAEQCDANPALTVRLNEVMSLYRANRTSLEALVNNGQPVSARLEAYLRGTVGLEARQ